MMPHAPGSPPLSRSPRRPLAARPPDDAGAPRTAERAPPRGELAHLAEVAPALAARVAEARLPAGVRLVALGDTSPSALAAVDAALEPRPRLWSGHGGEPLEDGLRRATVGLAPRGRVLALLLGDTLARLARAEARRGLRGLRRQLLRRDLLLLGLSLDAPEPRRHPGPRGEREVDLEAALDLVAGAGFVCLRDWRSGSHGHALALLAAD